MNEPHDPGAGQGTIITKLNEVDSQLWRSLPQHKKRRKVQPISLRLNESSRERSPMSLEKCDICRMLNTGKKWLKGLKALSTLHRRTLLAHNLIRITAEHPLRPEADVMISAQDVYQSYSSRSITTRRQVLIMCLRTRRPAIPSRSRY
jgi:hypothetical protein